MVGKRLSILLAAGSLAVIGAAVPAVADTPRPGPAPSPAPVSETRAPSRAPAAAAFPADEDPRLVRRCLQASQAGQVPSECRRVLDALTRAGITVAPARPGVRATPRFTG